MLGFELATFRSRVRCEGPVNHTGDYLATSWDSRPAVWQCTTPTTEDYCGSTLLHGLQSGTSEDEDFKAGADHQRIMTDKTGGQEDEWEAQTGSVTMYDIHHRS